MSPQQIAHYRITAKLGQGGMGEVWRATDTKLNREVAIKVLPEEFARDTGRMARFSREAQVLASLNHPNIASIYGVEERALVMELVEGETLKGPLPLAVALDYARQIAGALEYAHEKGVVHRDLKPANIKVTPDGVIKVLDFGLAKAMSAESAPGDPAVSPTMTMGATVAGVILGTAGYMSPEQAKGKPVDRRADIWAFGVVLWEILTGKQMFGGETVSDVLAQVLTKEPALAEAPAAVTKVLRACLQRDPKLRLKSIDDWRLLFEEPAAHTPAHRRSAIPWIAATALALALAGAGWWRAARPEERPLVRLSVDLGPDAIPGFNLTAAISPDGRRLVFPVRGPDGNQQLATRLLDQAQITLLPGTTRGSEPFFSPDGQWIGFFAPPQIKKISVHGGAAMTIASSLNYVPGASWSDDGSIVLEPGTTFPLMRLPVAGGAYLPITKLGLGEITHRWPQTLPGGEAILYTASSSAATMSNANIAVYSIKTGRTKFLQKGGYYGRYLPTGHLVYLREGVLFGVRFIPANLEVRGTPVPLLDDVAANPFTGGGQFDFSNNGTFVYSAGKVAVQGWQVSWLSGSGKLTPLITAPGAYGTPRLSPDGRKLAFQDSNSDVRIYDLERDTFTSLTFVGGTSAPVWTPDGKHIVVGAGAKMLWLRSDGAGDPYEIFSSPNIARPWSFAQDGRLMAYFERNIETGFDLSILPLDLTDPDHPKAGTPEHYLHSPADEMIPCFSPDGRWVAYRSNESGNPEIQVRPFPAAPGGQRHQISTGGALYPFWSNNGHELFYLTVDGRIMVVEYAVKDGSFVPGKPRPWSSPQQLFFFGTQNLDLAPDGKRFAVFTRAETVDGRTSSAHVTMLLNFFDELKRRIP